MTLLGAIAVVAAASGLSAGRAVAAPAASAAPAAPAAAAAASAPAPGYGAAAISITRTASATSTVDAAATYTYLVTNHGSLALRDVTVTDAAIGDVCDLATLAAGQTTTCTATFSAVEASSLAVSSTATSDSVGFYAYYAAATDVSAGAVAGSATVSAAMETTTVAAQASFAIRFAEVSGASFSVSNAGNAPLLSFAVTSATELTICRLGTLATGQSATCAASHAAALPLRATATAAKAAGTDAPADSPGDAPADAPDAPAADSPADAPDAQDAPLPAVPVTG